MAHKKKKKSALPSTKNRKNIKQKTIAAQPKLDGLPNELLFQIFEHLNPVHATCAGLTCKTLWAIRNKPSHPQPSKLFLYANYISLDPNEFPDEEFRSSDDDSHRSPFTSQELGWDQQPPRTYGYSHHFIPSDSYNRKFFLCSLLHNWMGKANYVYDEDKRIFVLKWNKKEKEDTQRSRKSLCLRVVLLIIGDYLRMGCSQNESGCVE
ncbi:hypothetical protein HYFRA_00004106 [Hymenoscyphus fraxineus]|uniref:F-box domain-containing protein n=1 Tax=Hymenoscyphus fraxineus TaxID=746836 RepID=A0A9N9KN83_9HELO|nr:hypothetical protein HYFRA_00004106 [Hymenoscyphus fraxineus]